MSTEEFQRKLTAILSADVQGYSRLMGEDEDSTVRTLTAYRALMISLIQKHRGHVVDTPGDNFLAKFGSVMDAVRCAVEIQEELRIRNAELPENRKMQFRIGINLGDVIEEGDCIYGDGINVAARIEGLAEGGGICVSGFVYGAIKNKLSFSFEFIGEHSVKNIKDPVRVYRVRMEPDAAAPKEPLVKNIEEGLKTIAVLPFLNLSSDPEQEYFVDGLSEELLNSLTKIKDLQVIARTSSFVFKGSNKKIQEIADELGANHILEGSVRKAGNALRITAQLIRATDGIHLWSETYNRKLEDIFAVQEDIATAVADELKVTLGIGESFRKPAGTTNIDAYELYLVAKGFYGALGEGDKYSIAKQAMESIEAAIELDPEFAPAWAVKATLHCWLNAFGPAGRSDIERDEAIRAAQRAIKLEPNLAAAYVSIGYVEMSEGNWVAAETAFRKALRLEPESSPSDRVMYTSVHYIGVGNFNKAHELLLKHLQVDPIEIGSRCFYMISFAFLGDSRKAEEEFNKCQMLFGDRFNVANSFVLPICLGSHDTMTRDDIKYPNRIYDVAKTHLDSPGDAIRNLREIFDGDQSVSSAEYLFIAMWAAWFGDTEFAMDAMEKSMSIETSGAFMIWMPVFEEVRHLPRFTKLVREIGLVDYWNEFGWPDICRPLENGDFVCD